MNNNIPTDFLVSALNTIGKEKEFGGKTIRLAELIREGYAVPTFFAISAPLVFRMKEEFKIDTYTVVTQIAHEVTVRIPATHYAVRSSALAEDGGNSSHAGEFLTCLNVPPEGVAQAIADVFRDAMHKGYVTAALPFSIIIQEFQEPELAGVLFTRHPSGEREMLLEWTKGRGEQVVSGRGGKRLSFLRGSPPSALPPAARPLVDVGIAIESLYNFPQDIEWAVSGGRLFLLQTRPITTITGERYAGILKADEVAMGYPKEYYYARGTLAESFSRPPILARSLLEYVYRASGPVERAYRKLGVHPASAVSFVTLCGAYYIDRESELRQFYPTHSYFGGTLLRPHVVTLSGLFRTMQNTRALAQLPRKNIDTYKAEFTAITHEWSELADTSATWEEHLLFLDAWYEQIFLVNVETEAAMHKLRGALRGSPHALANVIGATLENVATHAPRTALLGGVKAHMKGNSLNIADMSVFQHKPPVATHSNLAIRDWYNALPSSHRSRFAQALGEYRAYEALREEGRWLTVLLMSGLRDALMQRSAASGIPNELCFFLTLDELRSGDCAVEKLRSRFQEQRASDLLDFPDVIASIPRERSEEIYGVSAGVATGTLSSSRTNKEKDTILLVDHLDPELVRHFPHIAGIIAREGGILSHLAIIAREYGIPVVVDRRSGSSYRSGDHVRIDGGSGTIEVSVAQEKT